ncbi:oxidase [Planotetraspora thailandica]|uniref:Oxidase n=1 Tax=Planotetraspora thailandica TaxID=487172 RepID=A0A8J3Y2K5_9ACTN|nr:pyridoxal 5'-phosphate synthase [Planotetraspora thailandica]GII59763.1 oxidase [Planotetraspora thailandica]
MSKDTSRDVRAWLRSLEVFAGPLATFDPAAAPDEPVDLFLSWLTEAVDAELPDPHAMTVSTVDEHGEPWARVLILKNVDVDGWQFAVHADSPKGHQLAVRPSAALTFYWAALGRQVRVRGPVIAEPADRGAADFLARSVPARAEALLGLQSRHLADIAERDRVIDKWRSRVEQEPDLVAEAWTLYTLVPVAIEFWQADKSRVHTRLSYERTAAKAPWQRHLLWP